MAQIVINVPDARLQRVLNGFAKNYGYQETVIDPATGETIDNPQSKMQFMRRYLSKVIILGAVKATESQPAVDAARKAAEKAVDDEIELT